MQSPGDDHGCLQGEGSPGRDDCVRAATATGTRTPRTRRRTAGACAAHRNAARDTQFPRDVLVLEDVLIVNAMTVPARIPAHRPIPPRVMLRDAHAYICRHRHPSSFCTAACHPPRPAMAHLGHPDGHQSGWTASHPPYIDALGPRCYDVTARKDSSQSLHSISNRDPEASDDPSDYDPRHQ
jgi:hypothetical protein